MTKYKHPPTPHPKKRWANVSDHGKMTLKWSIYTANILSAKLSGAPWQIYFSIRCQNDVHIDHQLIHTISRQTSTLLIHNLKEPLTFRRALTKYCCSMRYYYQTNRVGLGLNDIYCIYNVSVNTGKYLWKCRSFFSNFYFMAQYLKGLFNRDLLSPNDFITHATIIQKLHNQPFISLLTLIFLLMEFLMLPQLSLWAKSMTVCIPWFIALW